MTFALVDHNSANWILGTTTTGTMNTGGANLMVAVGGGDSHTISDSNGNTWVDIFGPNADGFATYVMQYVSNPTVGASHTVSITSGGRISVCVSAWSGATSVSPLDSISVTGTGAAVSSLGAGNTTPSQANSLGIMAAGDIFQAGSPLTTNIGTITDIADPTIGDFANGAMGYEIQTAATARNYTWQWSGTTGVHIVVFEAFFKASASSSSGGTTTVFSISSGTYSVSGKTSTFRVGFSNASGSYSLSGRAQTYKLLLNPTSGSYSISGKPVTLDVKLNTTSGHYAVSGKTETYRQGIGASSGSYSISGKPASFIPAPNAPVGTFMSGLFSSLAHFGHQGADTNAS